MEPKTSYYIILFVYCSLWGCQLVACHLTHSLIILTDSYINLYKILDVSLGVLHLKVQYELDENDKMSNEKRSPEKAGNSVVKLFGRICTYRFKRLPILGSFVNGLFLAALLMSAAIEGIQTCFHASHSEIPGEKSILMAHPITYPLVLVGFALVGLMMQWCTSRAHEMRGQKLGSPSLLDVSVQTNPLHRQPVTLDVGRLTEMQEVPLGPLVLTNPDIAFGSNLGANFPESHRRSSRRNEFVPSTLSRPHSLDSVPAGLGESTSVSLRSLKIDATLIEKSDDLMKKDPDRTQPLMERSGHDKLWTHVRFFTSPVALTLCALIVYYINHEMVTEIVDAGLAVMVVVLLFFASYPPMKKAGKLLLQTAPDGLNLERLKRDLIGISPLIIDVDELRVWGLTPKTHWVATCHLLLDKKGELSEKQISSMIKEAKKMFLRDNIKCTAIEPKLIEIGQHDHVHKCE